MKEVRYPSMSDIVAYFIPCIATKSTWCICTGIDLTGEDVESGRCHAKIWISGFFLKVLKVEPPWPTFPLSPLVRFPLQPGMDLWLALAPTLPPIPALAGSSPGSLRSYQMKLTGHPPQDERVMESCEYQRLSGWCWCPRNESQMLRNHFLQPELWQPVMKGERKTTEGSIPKETSESRGQLFDTVTGRSCPEAWIIPPSSFQP